MPADPLALLRSRSYLVLLAAIIGAPVSAAAYGFLAVVSKMGLRAEIDARTPRLLGRAAGPKHDVHFWFTQVVRCASRGPARTIFSAQ